jgi:hypothetical protein
LHFSENLAIVRGETKNEVARRTKIGVFDGVGDRFADRQDEIEGTLGPQLCDARVP